MGLKDRLKGGVRHLWSPITVWMAEMGSDQLVVAGQPARVVVDVRGEDDGSADRVEVVLKLTAFDVVETWPLGTLPPTLGPHTLEVTIPTGLAPSCAKYAEYTFHATLHRTKGMGSDAASPVDVVARPEDAYWPDGPREGCDGADAALVSVTLDGETVDAGTGLAGTATIAPVRDLGTQSVDLVLGVTVTAPYGHKGEPRSRYKPVTRLRLAADLPLGPGAPVALPFRVDVPEGVPPTLHNGAKSSVVWDVRVAAGGAEGWRRVAVMDPTGAAGVRNRASPTLLDFLGSLESPGR